MLNPSHKLFFKSKTCCKLFVLVLKKMACFSVTVLDRYIFKTYLYVISLHVLNLPQNTISEKKIKNGLSNFLL